MVAPAGIAKVAGTVPESHVTSHSEVSTTAAANAVTATSGKWQAAYTSLNCALFASWAVNFCRFLSVFATVSPLSYSMRARCHYPWASYF